MKISFVLFFIAFTNLIFCQVSEKILNDNFIKSLTIYETVYLIEYKNLNTNEIREIAIDDWDFHEAYIIENNILLPEELEPLDKFFNVSDLIKNNNSRYFEFKNSKALEILNKNYISNDKLILFEKKHDIQNVIKKFKNDVNYLLEINSENFADERYYKFLLLKSGYIINYFVNCFAPSGLFCENCLEK